VVLAGCEEDEVVVKEVGACFQQRWSKWVSGADGVVVVVDASPEAAHSTSMVALLDVLELTGESSIPTLILLNKCDKSSRREVAKVYGLLEMDSLTANSHVAVIEGSALTGHNMPLVLEWMNELGKG